MDIRDLIPNDDMPMSGAPRSFLAAWWGMDSEEGFRERGGHPTFDENSVEYRFNSRGYRCPEFDEQADIRMVSIGCGYTAGEGLPKDAIFHERFAELLRRETGQTVVNWNLGEHGAGNDVIERVLHVAVPLLDPDIVLILFPDARQREYLSPMGLRVMFAQVPVDPDPRVAEMTESYLGSGAAERKPILDKMARSSAREDDDLRFFRSYKSIEALLADRCWLFGVTSERMESLDAFQHVDRRRHVGSMRVLDLSRDSLLPGPYSHELLCQGFWNTFERLDDPLRRAGQTTRPITTGDDHEN